jgi:hypothetical protein
VREYYELRDIMQVNLFIEVGGKQVDTSVFLDNVKEFWKSEGNKIKDLKSVQLYYKPDDGHVYYVINGDINGKFMA